MLTQLGRVSLEADGRFATETELQFLKDYLESAEHRINAYQKIRDTEEQIMDQVEEKALEQNARVFFKGTRDMSATCRRDRKQVLKSIAAAMLVSDLDYLRDSMLLWTSTLMKAFQTEQPSKVTYQLLPSVVKEHLTTEEMQQVMPALQFSQTLLS